MHPLLVANSPQQVCAGELGRALDHGRWTRGIPTTPRKCKDHPIATIKLRFSLRLESEPVPH
jgi:hypothetical protein